ncbi:NADH-quinone oxidoreductase subunit NuoE [Alphaproteobacteria bacterium]|nr:NADH-quinone oxidoreductase subunit NuoE [Alphaproteobacteria bacterium]
MTSRKPAPDELQPKDFQFNEDNLLNAKSIISNYPSGKQASAIMPLFDLAQRQHSGWLPIAAINYVADMIGVNRIRAYEVATFYTMYNLAPVGKNVIQVCTTTPCKLRGSDNILSICKKLLNVDLGKTSSDGNYTLLEVECLGACVNAPVIWIGDDYYEDLDEKSLTKILNEIKVGSIKSLPGSQIGRTGSEPMGERKSLITEGSE